MSNLITHFANKCTDEGLICEPYEVLHICTIQTKSVGLVTVV